MKIIILIIVGFLSSLIISRKSWSVSKKIIAFLIMIALLIGGVMALFVWGWERGRSPKLEQETEITPLENRRSQLGTKMR